MELSENTMREYFDRIVTQFQFLTTAGKQVEDLQTQVEGLKLRVQDLENENYNLHARHQEMQERVERVQQESNDHEQRAHDVSQHVKVLQDTIVYGESRVADLQRNLHLATESKDNAIVELQAVKNNNDDLQILVADLRHTLSTVETEREQWKQDAQTANEQIVKLRDIVDKVNNLLSPGPHSFLQAVG